MHINSIRPSFHGYIKIKERENYVGSGVMQSEKTRIFNTNSIAIESVKLAGLAKPGYTKIISNGKEFKYKYDFATLQKAILLADKMPDKIIEISDYDQYTCLDIL